MNFLVEGVSGTGKTSVCNELARRGYRAINGDRELAYQGDPVTGERLGTASHENHIWDVEKVRQIVADKNDDVAFLCGGSRNFSKFIHLMDGVFVLDVDVATLNGRLQARPVGEFGGKEEEREVINRLHSTKEDIPSRGIVIDATAPLEDVVDKILQHVGTSDWKMAPR